jgi:pSer/pThr/pTyr-binding forkhead associated (FHA) protein
MFKLVIQDDEGKTTVVPLIRDEITIGRKEGNTIRLTERNVSRRHARILRNNGEVQIEDLGSYNGIRVNNARIAERVSLRVSDQVQIGDYKLYLKAEGVEQVDDARTMPIERVDTANTATDVIPAVTGSVPTPTVPMGVATPAPGTLPPAAQVVGQPNRTMVALGDTDPAGGRPVASPAQVAAVLSSPVGYGKLVVLSSNFAGKEFELSRPQMIVGRTDENDIVVNHRSISRNHAKVTRDPDTGRYTISDLQSSNGVRVNGQDYGKVELRRGDVVDLGHVRLRFVEAGEDFVFTRDAVITDVPETGSKKSAVIAVIAAVVVLAGGLAVYLMRNGGDDTKTKKGSNDENPIVAIDAGPDQVAMADAVAEDITPDTSTGVAPVGDDVIKQLNFQCKQAVDAKRWDDLLTCSDSLKAHDKPASEKYYKQAHAELSNRTQADKLAAAAKTRDYKAAKTAFDAIGEDSVYRKDAKGQWDKLEDDGTTTVAAMLRNAKKPDCKAYNDSLRKAKDDFPPTIISKAVKEVGCTPKAENPPPEKCNYDELFGKGQEAFSTNSWQAALQAYEAAYRCKPDSQALKLTVAAACRAKNIGKARTYWNKMTQGMRDQVLSICVGAGVTADQLKP